MSAEMTCDAAEELSIAEELSPDHLINGVNSNTCPHSLFRLLVKHCFATAALYPTYPRRPTTRFSELHSVARAVGGNNNF
jgi:hypothetical protein